MSLLSEPARKIAEEAKTQGLWLYDPDYRRWYSPEQFMHTYSYADAKPEFLSRLQIRHPLEGIEAGFLKMKDAHAKLEGYLQQNSFPPERLQAQLKKIRDIQARLEAMTKTVVEYYKTQ